MSQSWTVDRTITTPLLLEGPVLDKRWGDRSLLGEFGLPERGGDKAGEIWLVSDMPGRPSRVLNLPGEPGLDVVMAEAGESILGAGHGDQPFPLIVKLLMAGRRLSVQVHPDGASARRLGVADRGKREAWWVVGARDGSCIWRGLERDCTVAEARGAITAGTFQELMTRHDPRAGDVYDIVPGTFHGVGDGVLLFEVQERCDVTFRVYDWGNPNTELHIEQALDVGRLEGGDGTGAATPAPFRMEPVVVEPDGAVPVGGSAGPEILVVLSGNVELRSGGSVLKAGPGATALWPATLEAGVLASEGGARLMRSVPEIR